MNALPSPETKPLYASHGFSLVELSIVLVILGLLTGGILAGQSLIRAAEVRSVVSGFQRYHAAYFTFRDKYMGIPGDFTKATDFWSSAGGTGADSACYVAQTSTNTTCNGNGDGQIVSITGQNHAERFLAWKHLANAGLVEGSYTGKTAGGNGTYVVTIAGNVPMTRMSNGFYDLFFVAETNANCYTASKLDANALTIYGNNSTFTILSPEEAWNIDTKLDDGSPVYGKIVSALSSSPYSVNCTSSDTATATYILTNSNVGCYLSYLLQ